MSIDLVTSSAVLAELVDGPHDAALWSALRRHDVDRRTVDDAVATRAGHLLRAAGTDSTNAVNAFVAATDALQAPAFMVGLPEMTARVRYRAGSERIG